MTDRNRRHVCLLFLFEHGSNRNNGRVRADTIIAVAKSETSCHVYLEGGQRIDFTGDSEQTTNDIYELFKQSTK